MRASKNLIEDLMKTLEENKFDMNSIVNREDYKLLCKEDLLEIEKYHLLEPEFIKAKQFMKDHKLSLYS
jgi:hypothetical protein